MATICLSLVTITCFLFFDISIPAAGSQFAGSLLTVVVMMVILMRQTQKPFNELTKLDSALAARLKTGATIEEVLKQELEDKKQFDDIASDLSQVSSQGAISAAEVSFSLSELRQRIERQANEIKSIVESSQQIAQIGNNIAETSKLAQTESSTANKGASKGCWLSKLLLLELITYATILILPVNK
jgi:methyl-accepting chemotaxis protein